MASSKEYLDFILEQLSGLDEISCRAMKPTKAAVAMMPDADSELPYEGAKEMLLADNVENRDFLRDLLEAMYDELPASKKKK